MSYSRKRTHSSRFMSPRASNSEIRSDFPHVAQIYNEKDTNFRINLKIRLDSQPVLIFNDVRLQKVREPQVRI